MAEYRGKKPNNSTTTEVAVVEGFLKLLVDGVIALVGLFSGGAPKGGMSAENRMKIRDGWEQVEMHLMQPNTHALAVSDADKLLDAALKFSGVSGTTMGERLKNARGKFPPDLYQSIWDAHKLRNMLAHEVGVNAGNGSKVAVAAFRSALYHLKALD